MKKYNHIIFDLGGVLVELGNTLIPEDLWSTSKKVTLQEWFTMPVAHQFEQGKINASHLAHKFIEDFELNISSEEFIELFSQWPKRISPGAEELLTSLAENHQLSVLSNCNEIHWPLMENKFGILKYFHHKFSSHLIGLTKPNPSLYKHVLDMLETNPSSVLFFDDNEKNIESANSIGINGVVVNSTKDIVNFLRLEKMIQ